MIILLTLSIESNESSDSRPSLTTDRDFSSSTLLGINHEQSDGKSLDTGSVYNGYYSLICN